MKKTIGIIGAGPIGLCVAIEAKKRGIEAFIIEKGSLVNSIYNFPTNMTFFSTSKKLEIGNVPFISHHDKPNRQEALEYFRRLYEVWKLNVKFFEEAKKIKKNKEGFVIHTDKTKHFCSQLVVATGFYDHPQLMDVKGEKLSKVRHYYDDPHPYINQKVAVIGAANSACDVALELFQKEAQVDMIVRGSGINERVKYWIRPNIENRIAEGSIRAHFNARVVEIGTDYIQFEQERKIKTIENDFVLAMTGFRPDYTLLKKFGIAIDDDPHQTPRWNEKTHETNIDSLYLAGVVCGGLKTNRFFIENAMEHADRIIEDILKK